MNAEAPDGGGPGVVKGQMMQMLDKYVRAADSEEAFDLLDEWDDVRRVFNTVHEQFQAMKGVFHKAFGDTALTSSRGEQRFQDAATQVGDKVTQLSAAIEKLRVGANRLGDAEKAHAKLEASLPSSHGAEPSTSDKEFKTSGAGVTPSIAAQRSSAFTTAHAHWAAQEAAIAAAEKEAHFHCKNMDDGYLTAQPPTRALSEEPYKPPAGVADSGAGGSSNYGDAQAVPAYAAEAPGSASKVRAAVEKWESVDPGCRYADGMGSKIRAEQQQIIYDAIKENIPQWDENSGMYINADGSATPSSGYATAEAAPGGVLGGIGPVGAMGALLGGTALAGGAMAALRARFGAASRVGALAGAGKASTVPLKGNTAGQRPGMAPKSGAPGSAAKGTGGTAGKGQGGRGPGGRGQKKDKKTAGKDQKWVADTDEDWLDPNYKGVPPVLGGEGPGRRE